MSVFDDEQKGFLDALERSIEADDLLKQQAKRSTVAEQWRSLSEGQQEKLREHFSDQAERELGKALEENPEEDRDRGQSQDQDRGPARW